MGRGCSARVTWRGCSCSRVQARKDVLLCGPHQYRSSKHRTARHESCSVQVLWNMRRMSVPGTLPSRYHVPAHRHAYHPRIDALLRDAARSKTQRGCQSLSDIFKLVSFDFRFLLERWHSQISPSHRYPRYNQRSLPLSNTAIVQRLRHTLNLHRRNYKSRDLRLVKGRSRLG